jgi:hypothetical protein
MYTVSSGNCQSFLCTTSSWLLMLTAGPQGQFPRCHHSRKGFLWAPFWGVPICDYSQRESCARFRTAGSTCTTSSSKLCTTLMLHCNHRSGHLKMEHKESLFLLWRHLGNWPRSPIVSMRSELLVAQAKLRTVATADGVRFTHVRWEIDFLLTFETALFFCEHRV